MPVNPTSDGGSPPSAGAPSDTAVLRGRIVDRPGRESRAEPARVAVVGAGAVGGYFAARAAQAGARVVLCVRRGGFDRLRIVRDSTDGGEQITEHPVRVIADPTELAGPVDWVILATKAHQTPASIPWLAAALGEATGVVVAQNGVRHAERIGPPVPPEAVLPAVVYVNAELLAPGVVRHRAYGVLQVPDSPLGERFARVLPPGDVRLLPDFALAAWTKLVSNSAVNSLTALTGRGIEVLGRDDIGGLALAVMRETAAVARADGVDVPPDTAELTLARLRRQPPRAGTSMLQDRLAGRPLEHEALIGAVVRIGAGLGVPTPVCAALFPLLAAISETATEALPPAAAGP